MSYHDCIIVIFGGILSYLLGSIPFGLIFTKIATGRDIRNEGSGNIGATNAARSGGVGVGFFVFLFDGLKGFAPAFIGLSIGDVATLVFSLSAFFGHLFPIFLKFKGGKGVSIFVFILLALNYKIALMFIVVWIVFFTITRYVSVASLVGSLGSYIYACFLATRYEFFISIPTMLFITTGVAFIITKHISNLHRLWEGKERKFNKN